MADPIRIFSSNQRGYMPLSCGPATAKNPVTALAHLYFPDYQNLTKNLTQKALTRLLPSNRE
jgi:hypothetical protein